ncbi:uncharacterized protein pecam1b isoform X3 [Narcine bancroftii]|uniref:uncharacterized protein pecam1b isoform X3 n=1 Tax=Narcine bancroftii TaxID=1343680 RepID=UPI003831CB59
MNVFFQLQFLFVLILYATCQTTKVPVSNPEISAKIDHKINEAIISTIYCLSHQGSLPIKYTLYGNKTLLKTYVAESQRKAEFIVPLAISELLMTLKCKAENGFDSKYSRELIIDLSVRLTSNPDPPVLGQQLTLNCTVTYETTEVYRWHFVFPDKNVTNTTEGNQFIIETANTGGYYCSMHGHLSNRIEVPEQDSNNQSLTIGVCIGPIMMFILVAGLICYCCETKVPVSNPEISAKIDHKINEAIISTIYCLSHQGSLPIKYTLYGNKTLLKTYVAESQRKAEFIVPLAIRELLMTLKCKAENGFDSKYSRGLIIDLSVRLTSNPDPPVLGQQLTLNCTVTYETTEVYRWHFVFPDKNVTNTTEGNQFIIETANTGGYYCSMHGHLSNRIEVPEQGPIMMFILVAGLICYCCETKGARKKTCPGCLKNVNMSIPTVK